MVELDSESDTFEVLDLKEMEEEAQEMVNSDVEEYIFATAIDHLSALKRNLNTEETMEKEEIPTEICYSSNYTTPPPTTPTHPMSLP